VRRFPALLDSVASGELLNPVRELEPGARPRDWTGSAACEWVERAEGAPIANDGSSAARLEQDASATTVSALARSDADAMPGSALAWSDASADGIPREPAPTTPGSIPSASQLDPQRYKVQFEASEEYVELVEKAKALLCQAAPRAGLAELHLRAIRRAPSGADRPRQDENYAPKHPASPRKPTASPTSGPLTSGGRPDPETHFRRRAPILS
jgi:hypothetical protein